MTSRSPYENNLDAFAPYHYGDENHIDSLTPLLITNLKLQIGNTARTKTKWQRLFAKFQNF